MSEELKHDLCAVSRYGSKVLTGILSAMALIIILTGWAISAGHQAEAAAAEVKLENEGLKRDISHMNKQLSYLISRLDKFLDERK